MVTGSPDTRNESIFKLIIRGKGIEKISYYCYNHKEIVEVKKYCRTDVISLS